MYPVREMSTGTPAIDPLVARKYFSESRSAVATLRSNRPDVGPCSASAATVSEMSSISTFSPDALPVSQRRLGCAAVHRYDCSAMRVTVPSSMTLPSSSHQGV